MKFLFIYLERKERKVFLGDSIQYLMIAGTFSRGNSYIPFMEFFVLLPAN